MTGLESGAGAVSGGHLQALPLVDGVVGVGIARHHAVLGEVPDVEVDLLHPVAGGAGVEACVAVLGRG